LNIQKLHNVMVTPLPILPSTGSATSHWVGSTLTRWPDHFGPQTYANSLKVGILLILLCLLRGLGADLNGSVATNAACAALLIIGLPHGAFDLELIKQGRTTSTARSAAMFGLYVAAGFTMFGLWQLASSLALGVFLIVAAVHFAEDWGGEEMPFFGIAMAVSLFAIPALTNPDGLAHIFTTLASSPKAAYNVDMLTLLAPVMIGVALVKLWVDWSGGDRDRAVTGLLCMAGMLFLPPIIGFALYFCVYHSPKHFAEGRSAFATFKTVNWQWIAFPVTLLALGLASFIYWLEARSHVADGAMATTFMTLSVLTIPHMLVPRLARIIVPLR
jgi:beta-carotene 15,15'-dioxygenase